MTYHHLSEYLRRQKARKSAFPTTTFLVLLTACLMAIWPDRWLAWIALALGLGMVVSWVANRQEVREAGSVDVAKWLDTLRDFADRGQLEERSHPKLAPCLENCARYRSEILQALHSPQWEELCRRAEWARVRQTCKEAAESLFQDALWASRTAFRPIGGRRATFTKQCEDPGFATHALDTVRQREAELSHLLEEVTGEPFMRPDCLDALARAKSELRELVAAEEELRLSSRS